MSIVSPKAAFHRSVEAGLSPGLSPAPTEPGPSAALEKEDFLLLSRALRVIRKLMTTGSGLELAKTYPQILVVLNDLGQGISVPQLTCLQNRKSIKNRVKAQVGWDCTVLTPQVSSPWLWMDMCMA